jgi:hypothetical protein
MSLSLTVPTDENGIVFDSDLGRVLNEAIAVRPFGIKDVYIYSYGWPADANGGSDKYNRLSVELAKQMLLANELSPPTFVQPPRESLSIGMHWPVEALDPSSPLGVLQLYSLYSLEHRADAVGRNAIYSLLRLMFVERSNTEAPLRFLLLGHSYGCKAICAALQGLQTDIENGIIYVKSGTSFRVVLLQPATDDDNLEPGDIYGDISKLPDMRILITKSSLDLALTQWFVATGKIANMFNSPRQALGAAGPSSPTIQAFGAANTVTITPGFAYGDMSELNNRLIVADLTPIHAARKAQGSYNGGFAGSHSDVYFNEIYQMIIEFFFG